MKTVLYADVLFLINFSMDFISLYMTFTLTRRRLTAVRGVAAAAFGAVFGVVLIYFGVEGLLSFVCSLFVSFFMMLIGLGRGLRIVGYIKYTVILWGIGALLAGAVSLVCSLGAVQSPQMSTRGSSALFVFVFAVGIAAFILRTVTTVPSAKSCTLEINSFGIKTRVCALVDSGNLVTEQLSGLPVIFVKRKAFSKKGAFSGDMDILTGEVDFIHKLSPDTKRRARVVSVQRVGGTKLLIGIVTSEVFLVDKGYRKNVKAVLVIENVADYGGYGAIVPSSLLY